MGGTTAGQSITGAFITLEGVDGCGKSTQSVLLAAKLRDRGLSVLETREPGGTPIGQEIRALLLNPAHKAMAPGCELLLYLADRIQHLTQVVRPALERGEVVICDRFHDATVAYQRHGRGLDFSPVAELIKREIAPHMPGLTLWLDLPLHLARERIVSRLRERGGKEDPEGRLDQEQQTFHRRVLEGYQTLHRAEPERIERVNAEGPVEAIAGEIWEIVEKRYGL